jgi:hypothetical protein
MFGLMRKNSNDPPHQNFNWRKHHYCGTCKVMGAEYGHQSRVFLNYDLVFLSELLAQLNSKDATYQDKAFESVNCMRLPDQANIPDHLQFAAAVGVLYADIKLRDNLLDNKNPLWKISTIVFRKPALKSRKKLIEWGLDSDLIEYWLTEQDRREVQRESRDFNYYAEPTAEVTAHIFKTGANFINEKASASAMEDLGRSFGKIIYWLDACEDFIKDKKQKAFNGLQVICGQLQGKDQIDEVERYLNSLEEQTSEQLQSLPIPLILTDQFVSRLNANLSIRLNAAFHKIEKHLVDQRVSKELSFISLLKFRIQNRWKLAKENAFRLTFTTNEFSQYAVAAAFFIIPKIPDSLLFEEIVYKKNTANSEDPCSEECGNTCSSETEECCNTLTTITICTCVVGVTAALICAFKDMQNEVKVAKRKQNRQLRKEKRAIRRRLRKLKKVEKV